MGYVNNDTDGLHIIFNQTSKKNAEAFAEKIIKLSPPKAIIQNSCLDEIAEQEFCKFSIRVQESDAQPELLISPDFAMCSQCRKEFDDPANRRYKYPFITCALCGPRYSIMRQLPYERHLTTMNSFIQCPECNKEYDDENDRRYFSQTNSCSACGIQLSWHTKNNLDLLNDPQQILAELLPALREGKTVAVKGIGGFLLLCDAANTKAIQILRERKHRPKKPFAVLFSDIEMVQQYARVSATAISALQNEASPIVLLQASGQRFDQLDMKGIAPGLSSIGVLLPYAPLLEWIISAWKGPLVATSGNLSGSCIVFRSEKKEALFQCADYILDHNRGITTPQDDSVIRFAEKSNQPIIIRRSRGLAPAIISLPPVVTLETSRTILAVGAMLKSAFAIQHNHQIYASQFLGNLESYDSQQNYHHTLHHFLQLLKVQPQVILADRHPDYPSTQIATEYTKKWGTPLKKIQHHEAHFAAILGEHNLFRNEEKILGVIWDGTGLGNDGNSWGGEFFLYDKNKMERVHFLEPFPNIAGDKMAREPRLAALAIAGRVKGSESILEPKFSKQEWDYYQKAISRQGPQNSSAGRYFDAVASLLGLVNINTYEGEAALVLEQHAYDHFKKTDFEMRKHYFNEEIDQPVIPMKQVMGEIINDIHSGKSGAEVAAIFHVTLAAIIKKVAHKLGVKKVAFSGGVFQNTSLIDLVYLGKEEISEYYFHRQMPPNDECIAFGQLMYYQNIKT